MKWYKTFSDGKGGFNTFEWNLGDIFTYGIINILVMLAIGLIFLAILPFLLVIILPFCGVKNMRINIVVSIILSTLFIIDYSVGGIFWDVFNNSDYSIELHKEIATFHASLIVMNFILFITAKNLANELSFEKSFNRVVLFIILIFVVTRVVFYPNLLKTIENIYSKSKYGSEIPKN